MAINCEEPHDFIKYYRNSVARFGNARFSNKGISNGHRANLRRQCEQTSRAKCITLRSVPYFPGTTSARTKRYFLKQMPQG
jgi:hypothetical protein